MNNTIGNFPNEIIYEICLYIKPEFIAAALLSIRPLADFFGPVLNTAAKFRDRYVKYHQDRAELASKGRETDATHFLGRLHGEVSQSFSDIFIIKKITTYSFGKEIKSMEFNSPTGKPSKITTPTRILKYFNNGELSRVDQVKDSKRHGNSIMFKKGGRIFMMKQYRNNLLHGHCTDYYTDLGKIKEEVTYVDGRVEGFILYYYKNGEIDCIEFRRNNMTNGIIMYFHENHGLKGKEIGIYIMRILGCYSVPLGICRETLIIADRKIRDVHYDRNGKFISDLIIRNW